MAMIDTAYVDAAVGAGLRVKMFATTGGTFSTAYFTSRLGAATEIVVSAWEKAGYTLNTASPTGLAKEACLGQLLPLGFARIKQDVPEHFANTVNLAELVRSGKIPDRSATASASGARGGFACSDQTGRDEDSYEPVFSTNSLRDFG